MRKILLLLITIFSAILVFAVIVFLFSLNAQKGALQVTSTPTSTVYLDGKAVGNTRLCLCDANKMIKEGRHTIKLVPHSGNFAPFEQVINISPKVLTIVDKQFVGKGLDSASIFSLSPIQNKKTAEISITTFPYGANIYLDGKNRGLSPLSLSGIKISDYELRVIKDGYKDKVIMINTQPGYKLEALIYLGIEKSVATASAIKEISLIASTSSKLNINTIKILDTPTGFLRVRQEASLTASEVDQVKPGETYKLVSEVTGWYEIKLSDKTGWISSRYAEKISLGDKVN